MKLILPLYGCAVVLLAMFLFQDGELKESMERGNEIYSDFCVTCHLSKGEGIPHTFPPLAKSDYLLDNRELSIKAVKYGLQGEIKVNGIVYNSNMAAMGLEDEEVADVMNYIANSWGNTYETIVTVDEVSNVKKE